MRPVRRPSPLYFHPVYRNVQGFQQIVVVLGMGGTIAAQGDDLAYLPGALTTAQLLAGVAGGSEAVEPEEVARIDSKDLDFLHWRQLLDAVARHLARPAVCGIVVTHGTDTLEETAYLLQRLLAPAKPVVLVGAMRPATAVQSDGPQNLADALRVAREPGAHGVVVVVAGQLFSALDVRKVHPFRLQAFSAGEAGLLGVIEAGRLRRFRDWPPGDAMGADLLPRDPADWPWVEIVTSVTGARGAVVDALVSSGVHGLVIASTGNGTVHMALAPALDRAQQRGVQVLRATRCLDGTVLDAEQGTGHGSPLPSAGALTPVQARIELMLRLAAPGDGRERLSADR